MSLKKEDRGPFAITLAIGLCLAVGGLIYKYNSSNSSNSSDSYTSPNSLPDNRSSTTATCVVCGKQCDYYHENTYMGHHVVIGGQMTSDVVCGMECDLILRRRNEKIIDKEMSRDPNSYRDPDIKYPDLHQK